MSEYYTPRFGVFSDNGNLYYRTPVTTTKDIEEAVKLATEINGSVWWRDRLLFNPKFTLRFNSLESAKKSVSLIPKSALKRYKRG